MKKFFFGKKKKGSTDSIQSKGGKSTSGHGSAISLSSASFNPTNDGISPRDLVKLHKTAFPSDIGNVQASTKKKGSVYSTINYESTTRRTLPDTSPDNSPDIGQTKSNQSLSVSLLNVNASSTKDDLPALNSARSIDTNRSWRGLQIGNSKWSDEEEDAADVGEMSFMQPGAASKASLLNAPLTSFNDAKMGQKVTNLAAADVMMEASKTKDTVQQTELFEDTTQTNSGQQTGESSDDESEKTNDECERNTSLTRVIDGKPQLEQVQHASSEEDDEIKKTHFNTSNQDGDSQLIIKRTTLVSSSQSVVDSSHNFGSKINTESPVNAVTRGDKVNTESPVNAVTRGDKVDENALHLNRQTSQSSEDSEVSSTVIKNVEDSSRQHLVRHGALPKTNAMYGEVSDLDDSYHSDWDDNEVEISMLESKSRAETETDVNASNKVTSNALPVVPFAHSTAGEVSDLDDSDWDDNDSYRSRFLVDQKECEEAIVEAKLVISREFNTINRPFEQLQNDLSQEKQDKEKLEAMVSSLKGQLTAAEADLQTEQNERKQLKMQMQSQADTLRKTLGQREEELATSHMKIQNLLEVHQKNTELTEALLSAKEELKSAHREKTLFEDEKRRTQMQLAKLEQRISSSEASLASANQSKQQLQTESLHLHRQVDVLKEKLNEEHKRTLNAESKVSELLGKLKNAENAISMTSNRLSEESSSIASLSKSKHDLETALHRTELDKAKLEVALDAERQKCVLLQREYDDVKLEQRKAMEVKQLLEIKLNQEEQRSSQLETEVFNLRTHFKASNERVKMNLPDYFSRDHGQATNLTGNYIERSELLKPKFELEASAQKELDEKLEEVNAYLVDQIKARERLGEIQDNNDLEIHKEFDRMKKELLDEVAHLKTGMHRESQVFNKDIINRQTKESELLLRDLCEKDARLKERFSTRLDQAMDNELASPSFFDQQHGDGAQNGDNLVENLVFESS